MNKTIQDVLVKRFQTPCEKEATTEFRAIPLFFFQLCGGNLLNHLYFHLIDYLYDYDIDTY